MLPGVLTESQQIGGLEHGDQVAGVVAGARHYDASMVSVFGNIQPDALAELINGKDATGKFARLLCVKVPLVGLNLRDEDETPEEEAALHKAARCWLSTPTASTNHHHAFTSFQLKPGVITTAGLCPGISRRLIHQRQR